MANRRTKVDVYSVIKEKILFLDMKPGDKIVEAELAEEMGVSRTPIREALKRLEEERFIDIYPQRGTYVALIDFNYVKEITYMRHILECAILDGLCEKKEKVMSKLEERLVMMRFALRSNDFKSYIKHDTKFHKELFAISGHEAIWNHISSVLGHYTRMLVMDMMIENNLDRSYEGHLAIIEAIESGDREKLRDVLEEHHDHKVTDTDRQIMETHSEYFL